MDRIALGREEVEGGGFWLREKFSKGQAWVDLLLLACHRVEAREIRGIHVRIEPGQLLWSEEALARRWRWSREKVRSFIGALSRSGDIRRKLDNRIGVISILKYDKYHTKPDNRPDNKLDNKIGVGNGLARLPLAHFPTEGEVSEEKMMKISLRYQVPLSFVRSKWDDVLNYCHGHSKKYTNFERVLAAFVKQDALKIRKEIHEQRPEFVD